MSIKPNLNPNAKKYYAHKGFTLAETVLTIAVLGILLSLTMPEIGRLLQKRDENTETRSMLAIQTALQDIAKTYNRLPSATASDNTFCQGNLATSQPTWAECIAQHSNLSVTDILNDGWGNPRTYSSYGPEVIDFMGTNLNIYFATIHSLGADREATDIDTDGLIPGVAVTTDDVFADSSDSAWWFQESTQAGRLQDFEELRAGGDDNVLKISTLGQQIKNHQTANKRLEAIADALDRYGNQHKTTLIAQVSSTCAAVPDDQKSDCINGQMQTLEYFIYAPPAQHTNDTSILYPPEIQIDVLDHQSLTGTEIYNGTDEQGRLDSMTALMRILGLPDDYCCNPMTRAVELDATMDPAQESPFYYYSNPLPIGSCSTADRRVEPPFVPASVRISIDVCE